MANFDIKTATVEECKALAYDVLSQIQRLQNDLASLNQAIAQKSQEEQKVNEVKEAPKK